METVWQIREIDNTDNFLLSTYRGQQVINLSDDLEFLEIASSFKNQNTLSSVFYNKESYAVSHYQHIKLIDKDTMNDKVIISNKSNYN